MIILVPKIKEKIKLLLLVTTDQENVPMSFLK